MFFLASFFADDALCFGADSVSNCRRLMTCIAQYCQASKQLVNFTKSNVLFSRNEEQNVLADVMQINLVQNVGNYLGLPTN